jgi:hypothetical protein
MGAERGTEDDLQIGKSDRPSLRIGPEDQGSREVTDFLDNRERQNLHKPAKKSYEQPFYAVANAFHCLSENILSCEEPIPATAFDTFP